MTLVGISHPESELPRYFSPEDLARLQAVADIRILGNDRPAALSQLGDVDILLGSWGMFRADIELLTAAPRLKAICYAAGSVKNFVTPESFARGVLITTAMHANAIPVAETTTALITLVNKGWFIARERMQVLKAPPNTPTCGNFGTVVGLVGFGAIARLVAQKLLTMDIQLLIYDPYAKDLPPGVESVGLLELARRAAVISLHAPDIPATHGMCGTEFFAAMRDGATIINTARGRLIDESALIAELRTGRIYAHLDVTHPEPAPPNSPFYTLPNVWLTPHYAGSNGNEIQRLGRYAIDECLEFIAGKPPRYPVTEAMLPTMA